MRHEQALHLSAIGRRAEDQVARHDPVGEDALIAIDVSEEQVQRLEPLDEAGLDPSPFGRRNDARKEVRRDDSLGRAARAVDGEGYALQQERAFQGFLAIGQGLSAQGPNVLIE